jgi:hypothetical protein
MIASFPCAFDRPIATRSVSTIPIAVNRHGPLPAHDRTLRQVPRFRKRPVMAGYDPYRPPSVHCSVRDNVDLSGARVILVSTTTAGGIPCRARSSCDKDDATPNRCRRCGNSRRRKQVSKYPPAEPGDLPWTLAICGWSNESISNYKNQTWATGITRRT